MSWSFTDSATPSLKDQVRILVGDVDSADQLISDESISVFLPNGSLAQTNVYLSAALVAERLARDFSRKARSLTAGGSTVNWGERATEFRAMARDLRMQALSSVAPFAGGTSKADVQAREDDTDRVEPFFTRTTGEPKATTPAAVGWGR